LSWWNRGFYCFPLADFLLQVAPNNRSLIFITGQSFAVVGAVGIGNAGLGGIFFLWSLGKSFVLLLAILLGSSADRGFGVVTSGKRRLNVGFLHQPLRVGDGPFTAHFQSMRLKPLRSVIRTRKSGPYHLPIQ